MFIFRQLLSSLDISLGSLYTCLIVRKIRFLVALSGQSALSGYPLEITLHSLRPLLTDKQCTEDALGIFQYLYSRGTVHLRQNIKFVAGMNVTTLISLRRFAGSSQESTTEESQHRATIDKAHRFRKWLVGSWSKKFAEGLKEDAKIDPLLRLISHAWGTGAKANATNESKESEFLVSVFDDRRTRRGLLPNAAWSLALELFCHDFEQPDSYRDDMLGLDQRARSYAKEVWASCKGSKMSTQYLQWAARVLGRARNSNDFDPTSLLQNERPSDWSTDAERGETSLSTVTSMVASYLFSGDRVHAGLAEETLRLIFYRASNYSDILAELKAGVAPAVLNGIFLRTEDVVVPLAMPQIPSVESCFDAQKLPSYDRWIRQLTTSLTTYDLDEAVVCSLDRILIGIPELADRLFAPILHIVLEQNIDNPDAVRSVVSQGVQKWFAQPMDQSGPHTRALLRAILYLRDQPYPQEMTHADRLKWLDIDWSLAARAAHRCGLHTAALMLAELTSFNLSAKTSRRSTTTLLPTVDEELMLDIYRNIDDPDSYYGVPQEPSLDLVLSRLDHEAEGFKSLMFRGARLDSQMRMVS